MQDCYRTDDRMRRPLENVPDSQETIPIVGLEMFDVINVASGDTFQ